MCVAALAFSCQSPTAMGEAHPDAWGFEAVDVAVTGPKMG